mgnify:CR=1 FL=1
MNILEHVSLMDVARVVATLVFIYLAIVGLMWLFQGKLIFQNIIAEKFAPAEKHLTHLNHHILKTPEGETLYGYSDKNKDPHAPLVVAFTGNAQNSASFALMMEQFFPDMQLLVCHYRGYAPSTGKPGQKALYADAKRIMDFAESHFKAKRTVLLGVSMGGAMATYASNYRDVEGLVLVTPFDSMANVGQETYPFVPVKLLVRHPMDLTKELPGNETPVAVLASDADKVISQDRLDNLISQIRNLWGYELFEDLPHEGVLNDVDFVKRLRYWVYAFGGLKNMDKGAD